VSGSLEDKVAFITGAARGQGRSHAIRLASEGADIIAVDICSGDELDITPYALGTLDDLHETVRAVKNLGRRIVALSADVRNYAGLSSGLDSAVDELGRVDIVCANAAIGGGHFSLAEMPESAWPNMIDVNLTGVWHTAKAAIPHLIAGGRGGSIVLTNSVGGLRGHPNTGGYGAAKHGLVGLMRTLALELAPHSIRVLMSLRVV
jgi:(+)-trans-carveol dehydrogenase